MLTQLPGFPDPVHDAQQTFRALLTALSRPGIAQATATLQPPAGLTPSCAATTLTLFDLETTVWLQPGLSKAVQGWLLFHTGCQFTDQSQAADFALIGDPATMPPLTSFNWGTPEYPEASTSLLIQCAALTGGDSVQLTGPGICGDITVDFVLSPAFWQQWQTMTTHFPLGVDAWCLSDHHVVGLPRTARPQR